MRIRYSLYLGITITISSLSGDSNHNFGNKILTLVLLFQLYLILLGLAGPFYDSSVCVSQIHVTIPKYLRYFTKKIKGLFWLMLLDFPGSTEGSGPVALNL